MTAIKNRVTRVTRVTSFCVSLLLKIRFFIEKKRVRTQKGTQNNVTNVTNVTRSMYTKLYVQRMR